ncbi:MAG: hypothetical protein V7640_3445, partial [Betaproteobacteria bacterium]
MSRLFDVRIAIAAIAILLSACISDALAAAAENIVARAKQERPALLDTLKELVAIESGSSDIEGLDRIREVVS